VRENEGWQIWLLFWGFNWFSLWLLYITFKNFFDSPAVKYRTPLKYWPKRPFSSCKNLNIWYVQDRQRYGNTVSFNFIFCICKGNMFVFEKKNKQTKKKLWVIPFLRGEFALFSTFEKLWKLEYFQFFKNRLPESHHLYMSNSFYKESSIIVYL